MSGKPPRDHAIGVGMGGSCPQCHAPVDVGQEFCLECGSHVRSQKRATSGRPGSAAAAARSAGSPGFPWTPFLVVLGLVTVGVVSFAMMNGSEPASTTITEPATPALTNTTPPPEDDFPAMADDTTTTADDCPPPGGSGEPVTDPETGLPSVPPMATDANGEPCPEEPRHPGSPTSGIDQPTVDDLNNGGGSGDAPADGTSWPAGKEGYTVVIASLQKGLYSEDDANLRAVDAQRKGITAGVLDSDQYGSVSKGLWVVFSGVFDSEQHAKDHVKTVHDKGELGAYWKPIKP